MKYLLLSMIIVAGLMWESVFIAEIEQSGSALVRYQIVPSRSTFVIHANRTGLAWFLGESHRIAVRDFDGVAEITLDAVNPASLQMDVRTASLEESDPEFTDQEKAIIKKELDEIVLESSKYPEISFRSTEVKGGFKSGKLEVEIIGDLTLHGVTRRIEIPANVTLSGNEMRAVGEFDIERDDFDIKATTAVHGLVRVKNGLKVVFDIIAVRT